MSAEKKEYELQSNAMTLLFSFEQYPLIDTRENKSKTRSCIIDVSSGWACSLTMIRRKIPSYDFRYLV